MIDLTNKKSLYRVYRKKKPNGKFRVICAPQGELKQEQAALAKKLGVIYDPHPSVYGYISGRSPRDLAEKHIGKDWVVTIDIKDFFPSITKDKVLSVGLSEYEAEVATLDGKCIQGSPCSPVISNMVMRPCDEFFKSYCVALGIEYSRYSDDIQLSGYNKPSWLVIKMIEKNLKQQGFQLNEKKIKFMFKNQRQEVLGICVNDKLSVNRKVRSQLKFRAKREMLTVSDKGMLSYIHGVMH